MQNQREVTLAGFRSGKFPVLVATDVAARGLDISGVELVVQCEPPKDPETYIHRSGSRHPASSTNETGMPEQWTLRQASVICSCMSVSVGVLC